MAIDDMKGNVTKGRVTMTGRMDDKPTTINIMPINIKSFCI